MKSKRADNSYSFHAILSNVKCAARTFARVYVTYVIAMITSNKMGLKNYKNVTSLVAVWLTLYKYLFAHTRDVVGTSTPATSEGATRCEGGIGSSTCYRHYHQAGTPENTGSKETRFESNFCLRAQSALVRRRAMQRAVEQARSDLLCSLPEPTITTQWPRQNRLRAICPGCFRRFLDPSRER